MAELKEGDPKIFLTPDGMDLEFVDGLPVMENGLENVVAISLGSDLGFSFNRIATTGAESVGSSFIEESKKAITVDQLKIIEDAAEKSLAWAVSDGLIKSATAEMIYVRNTGYQLQITIAPPVGNNRILIYGQNGDSWVAQQIGV